MKRRLVAALVAVGCLLASSIAQAAPAKTSSTVLATIGSQRVMPLVTAAWSVEKDKGDRLHIAGHNPPACVTLVRASWVGSRRGDRNGRFIELSHDYVYDPVREGASAEFLVEYRLNGAWYAGMHISADYVGSIGLTKKSVVSVIAVRASAVAGRTVAVRVTLTVRYPEPAFDIDDTFRVLPPR